MDVFILFTFIGFLIVGAFSSWVFKFMAGVFEGVIIFPLFGLKDDGFERALVRKPRRLLTVVILKNTVIGLVNSLMILRVCVLYVNEYHGNYWFYFSMGILWSLFILSDNKAFTGVFFWTSTINFVLMWFGFGIISLIGVGILTFTISIAYYYGRIGMYQQAYRNENSIDI